MSAALPRGACDCHCHVFGPAARFPYAEPRSYTPDDAPLEAYLALLDRLGFERGVLVQPSAYGRDNAAMLDALSARTQAPARRGGRRRRTDPSYAQAMARSRRTRAARQRIPPRRQTLLPERRRFEGNRAAAAATRRSRLAPAIVGRCARPARNGRGTRARAGAGGGRSHGSAGTSSRHAQSRLPGAAARRRRRKIMGEVVGHLSPRCDGARLCAGAAVPRRADRRQSGRTWCGAPTGRIRARKDRCRMRRGCSRYSSTGRKTWRCARPSSPTIRRGYTIFQNRKGRSVRPSAPPWRAAAWARRVRRASSSAAA